MSYVDEVISRTIKENPSEVEFHQTLNEVLKSIEVVVDENEDAYRRNAVLERLVNVRIQKLL